MIYESIEVVITLRCNARCANCIRLCNAADMGLDYTHLDMTAGDISLVIGEVEKLAASTTERPVVHTLCVTGGEPTLHPKLEVFWEWLRRTLHEPGLVGEMMLNTNGTRPVPAAIAPHAVTWWLPGAEKAANHTAMFVDPAERGEVVTRATCEHYRKNRIVVTSQGWTRCCASEGYTRLAGATDLILPTLPMPDGWPDMDHICAHCAFGAREQLFEHAVGRPVSKVYQAWAAARKAGA
jgi:organic radical activating enzyme